MVGSERRNKGNTLYIFHIFNNNFSCRFELLQQDINRAQDDEGLFGLEIALTKLQALQYYNITTIEHFSPHPVFKLLSGKSRTFGRVVPKI